MANELGQGLTVVINSSLTQGENWKCFSLWRSLSLYLPDAKILLAIKRGGFLLPFKWCEPVKLPYTFYNKFEDVEKKLSKYVVLPSSVVCIGKFNDDFNTVEAKDDDYASFVSYKEGVGTFDTEHNYICPFKSANSYFGEIGMNAKEQKILNFWESIFNLYALLN
jgi:hypothetical protein